MRTFKRFILSLLTVVALCGRVDAAIVLAQSCVSSTATSGTSLTVAFGSNNAAGNFIVVGSLINISGGTDTISDSRNSYNNDVTYVSIDENKIGVWSALNIGAGANTVSASGGGNFARHLMTCEYSGIATSGAFDKSASSTGFGTSLNSGNTATTAEADELLIGIGASGNAAAPPFSPGASYTERLDVASSLYGSYLEERIVSSTGAYSATATSSSNSNWSMIIATYKAGAAAASCGGLLLRGAC